MTREDFIKICKMTQPELKTYLTDKLKESGYEPLSEDGFVYAAQQNCPILLTAHMDTVHKEPVREVKDDETGISSPQGIGGDDRCGIFIIFSLLATSDYRPAILLCEDEEIGGVGSDKFCMRDDLIDQIRELKFLVELDRMNADDAVYYDDDNIDFHAFVNSVTGYKINYGSFSDISNLMPEAGVSGVNLSCGYYKPHTTEEYVRFDEMTNTVTATMKLCAEAIKDSCKSYQFVERKTSWWRPYDGSRDGYYDDDYSFYLQIEYTHWTRRDDGEWVQVEDEAGYDCVSEADGFMQFFKDHPNTCWNDILDYQLQ